MTAAYSTRVRTLNTRRGGGRRGEARRVVRARRVGCGGRGGGVRDKGKGVRFSGGGRRARAGGGPRRARPCLRAYRLIINAGRYTVRAVSRSLDGL